MSDPANPPQDPSQPPSYGDQPPPAGPPSPYGQPSQSGPSGPPPPPYGQPSQYGPPQPNAYGQAQPGAYGQAPYGQYGAPGYAPAYDYAHWIKRVGSSVIDGLIMSLSTIPGAVLLGIGAGVGSQDMTTTTDQYGTSTTTGDWNSAGTPLLIIGGLLLLVPIAVFVWNICLRQGRTGYSIGKQVLGTKLISEATAQPIGAGMSFVRYLCHIVDGFCYIGYLWPLWDAKRQTFADKIISTVVINEPKP